jgi:hypothetical protein
VVCTARSAQPGEITNEALAASFVFEPEIERLTTVTAVTSINGICYYDLTVTNRRG